MRTVIYLLAALLVFGVSLAMLRATPASQVPGITIGPAPAAQNSNI
jgi:hypothetical protein